MARRSKKFLDDGDSSSSSRSGSDDEDSLAGQKRKRRGGRGVNNKEDAIYGIFAEEQEEVVEDDRVRARRRDLTRAPGFVKGATETMDDVAALSSEDEEDESSSGEEEEEEDDNDDDEMLARGRDAEPSIEDIEMRPTFGGSGGGIGFGRTSQSNGGPTAQERQAHEDMDLDKGGFRPASFVSSRGGIGSTSNGQQRPEEGKDESAGASSMRGGIGSTRAGIGSQRGGIGSRSAAPTASHPTFAPSQLHDAGVPSSFGANASATAESVTPSSAFSQRASSSSSSRNAAATGGGANGRFAPKTNIKFGAGHGGGFDPSKYLAQMGWTGGGLGRNGEGIVNPIEVLQRPSKAGLAFGGRKEKTKQAKEEARRRGEEVSTDEDEREARKKRDKKKSASERRQRAKEEDKQRQQAWTTSDSKKKPRKPKVQHRTYEQIIEEHGGGGGGATPGAGDGGPVIDATGKEMREVSSLSAALAHHAVPTSDTTRLPELRHNLRLICQNNQTNLDTLARQGTAVMERKKWLVRERDESMRRKARHEAEAKRLASLLEVVRQLEKLGREAQSNTSIVDLQVFSPAVKALVANHSQEIQAARLDEAVVGAAVPVMRRLLSHWSPLVDPNSCVRILKEWRPALAIESDAEARVKGKEARVMTPYESLIWNLWMPPVRSALNNDWDPCDSQGAIKLVETWQNILPAFVRDNITQQLILPKLNRAVADWEPPRQTTSIDKKKDTPLHALVFPWLPLLGEQMDDVMQDAKRRVRAIVKAWKVSRNIPAHLLTWRPVFSSREWDSMCLAHVVPKLSAHLRTEFKVNPANQQMEALEDVLVWRSSDVLRTSIVSKILAKDFLPKWLEALYQLLVDPRANLAEVAQWYQFWKNWFQPRLGGSGKDAFGGLLSLQRGFQRALDVMQKAIDLGESRSIETLQRPSLEGLASRDSGEEILVGGAQKGPSIHGTKTSQGQSVSGRYVDNEDENVSFAAIVQEAASEADLLVQTLTRRGGPDGAHPLLRVSRGIDGKGGVTFYVEGDVIFREQKRSDTMAAQMRYEPISLTDLIEMAAKK